MAVTHGTIGRYQHHRCKCAACLRAWSVYIGLHRAKRRSAGLCIECSTPSPLFSRCAHHRLLNAMRNAARKAALKKDEAMIQTTAILILLVVALLSVACGEARESMTGPTAIGGAPTPGQLRGGAPVEILD